VRSQGGRRPADADDLALYLHIHWKWHPRWLWTQVQLPVCTKAAAPTPKPARKKPTYKTCKPGYERSGGICAQCHTGTASPDGRACRLCPKGSYSSHRGATKCIECASAKSSQTFTDDAGNKCWLPVSNRGRTGCGASFKLCTMYLA